MRRTYLVTGGTGFLGAALVRRLVADGHTVRVLDNDWRGRASRLDGVQAVCIQADIRNEADVVAAAAGVDSLVHLAYVNGTRFFYEQPGFVLDVGIRGTLNALKACQVQGVKEFVLASSSEVYQTPSMTPTPEDVPLIVPDVQNPRYSYGGGKIAAELLAIHSGLERVVIFRPHNVYGPDMGDEHVVPQMVSRMLRMSAEQPEGVLRFPVLGAGDQVRAFVHVDDFTDALAIVLWRGAHRNVYHLGNPDPVTIGTLAREIARLLGREIELVATDAPPGETRLRCPDITKISALGFQPRVSLRDGLRGVIEWHKSKPETGDG